MIADNLNLAVNERLKKSKNSFDFEYKRLNSKEQRDTQAAFCTRYQISPTAFRARLCGTTRYSETELVYLKKIVNTYFY